MPRPEGSVGLVATGEAAEVRDAEGEGEGELGKGELLAGAWPLRRLARAEASLC